MKKMFTILGIILFGQLFAQWDNGPLSTGTESEDGIESPAGYEFSELQYDSDDDDTNSSAGLSGSINLAYMLSDDFRVPGGEEWNVESVELFAYSTGYTGPCPIEVTNVFFFDHMEGEEINFPQSISSCENTQLLRVFNSIDEPTLFQDGMMLRQIYQFEIPVTDVTLGEGYYSIRFQSTAVGDAAHFYPTVTVPGERSIVTEMPAQQSSDDGGSWNDVVDMGYFNVGAPQDFPFIINYATMGTNEVMSLDNRIKLYPNPTKDIFQIFVPENFNKSNLKVSIKDMTGKVVSEFNLFNEGGYNVNSLPSGIYVVTITDGKNINTNKLIKQ